MTRLRIIGDVHGQLTRDEVRARRFRSYLEIIADAEYSVQLGDMGDAETYGQLTERVDPECHRFLAGNHDEYDRLPAHSLGDFGAVSLGGVEFFYLRGAASADREVLIRRGCELGRPLWFAQEELTDEQMRTAEQEYLQHRPAIVLSHDGPDGIARFAWEHARRMSPPVPSAVFSPSRTGLFLSRLLEQHRPRLWLFGHHHDDWRYEEYDTQFVCLGELSQTDIGPSGAAIASR